VITFVIVGHNEADTVATVVKQARAAAHPRDRVIVVDSASTDGTFAAAAATGVEVLRGPIGKGAAMRAGVDACPESDWVCFLDADMVDAEHNIAERLADRARIAGAPDQIVGDFDDGLHAVMTLTHGFYEPLVAALFPEVAGAFGSKPLTGFRVVRRERLVGEPIPPDYGVESYLNICITLAAGPPEVVHLGRFDGKMKVNRLRVYEITDVVLDLAVRFGRLRPEERSAWQSWVDEAYLVVEAWDPDGDQETYRQQITAVARRPTP
jgi:glucosyl-3-phosphoglycerate synthase